MDSPASFTSGGEILRFGLFEIDVAGGELRKSGTLIRLPPQPFKVLVLLASRAGELVSRESLQQEVWGRETFVDFDQGISFCIKKIRAALRDNSHTPRYIETVPRRGYRFIAPVEKVTHRVAPLVPPPPSRSSKLWRWVMAVLIAAMATAPLAYRWIRRTSGEKTLTLAVLPFQNLSGDPEQEYFSDGMTEALITELGQIRGLLVISRSSSMHYKGATMTLPQIARELHADAVVEGSAVRSGGKVRITAQLVEASKDRHLWAKSYERGLGDVLALQDEVARTIAGEIGAQIAPRNRVAKAPLNPEAVDAYLKARYFFAQDGIVALGKSVEYFEEAIRKDANYAAAYSGLSRTYVWLGHKLYLPPQTAFVRARTLALKAISIDDQLAEAHTDLADVKFLYDWNWSEAEKEFQRAIELNASDVHGYTAYAGFLWTMGRTEAGVTEVNRSLQVDPLSLRARVAVAFGYFVARQYDKAIEAELRILDLQPGVADAHLFLGLAYEQKGNFPAALEQLQKATDLSGDRSLIEFVGYALGRSGKKAEAKGMLDQLIKLSKETYVSPWKLAVISAGLGNNDQTLAYLEQAYAGREHDMTFSKIWPMFDALRSDARYKDLERRIGLR
jgi:TolB-like protein/DNA-binding winged helix-turn-helix (wHTH) protein/Tfp pilus assembly protein PilF